jgi:hypothetical protein
MEQERKCALEKKIATATFAITVVMVMVFAGLAGLVSVKPAAATSYYYAPNAWVPLGMSPYQQWFDDPNVPGGKYTFAWSYVSPECWVFKNHNYQNVIHAHDLAHMAKLNRTTDASAYINMMQDPTTGTYWNHAAPDTNNFIIYPLRGYFISWNSPITWWDQMMHPSSPPVSYPWTSYGVEIYFGYPEDGQYSNHTIVEDTAWAELNPDGWGQNYVGMYGPFGWYSNGTHYASDLINRMYYENGSPYAGQYGISFWSTYYQSWHTYNPCHPEWNFVLTAHMSLRIWVNQHCHMCWSPNNEAHP